MLQCIQSESHGMRASCSFERFCSLLIHCFVRSAAASYINPEG